MKPFSALELQNKAFEELTASRLPILRVLFEFMEFGEEVHWVAPARHGAAYGFLVISDRRIVFLVNNLTEVSVTIPYLFENRPVTMEVLPDGIAVTNRRGTYTFHTHHADLAHRIYQMASEPSSQES